MANFSNKTTRAKFELPSEIHEGKRNDTIFRYGVALKNDSTDNSDIARMLKEANALRCVPPMEESELGRITRSVLSLRSGKPIGTGTKQGKEISRVEASLRPTEQAARQLEALFSAEDVVAFVTKFSKSSEGKFVPNGKAEPRAACKVIEDLHRASAMEEVFPDYNKQAGILFYINPMKVNGRKNTDVTAFRSTLIEYDDIGKDEQIRRLLDSGLPILSMTDSGNKSIHAVVRIDAKDDSEFKKSVTALHKALERGYGSPCDGANKNPARMSRLAGAKRGDSIQTLLYTEVNMHASLETFLNRAADDMREGKGEDVKLGHNEVGKALIDEYGACLVDGAPAIKSGGEYLFGQDAVHRAVLDIREDAGSHFRKEVMGYLRLKAPKRTQDDSRYIRFTNGVLDIGTFELTANDGDHLILNEIPHNWNPEARSGLVDETFSRIAMGDPSVVANLWEMLGLSMYRGHEIQRMILLQGSGANGKSTLLEMLRHVLGLDNCFSMSVHELGEKFQLVPAMGKLALIGDDIASDYVRAKACQTQAKTLRGRMH